MRGFGSVRRRKGSRFWWVCYSVRGKEFRESSRSIRKEDAKDLLRKRLEQCRLLPALLTRPTLAEILEDYYRDAELRGVRDLMAVRASGRLASDFCGHELAQDIDTLRLHQLQEHLSGMEYKPASVNRVLAFVRAAFGHAARSGKIHRIPVMPRKLRENNVRQGFLEYVDYAAILEALEVWARGPFTFAYHSGWRKMEILWLRWSEVDLSGGVIRLDPARSKTRKPRVLPLRGPIRSSVEREVSHRFLGVPHVFHRAGAKITESTYDRQFKKACIAAGRPNALFHDTRRTCARAYERAGVPRPVAMALMGHETEGMYRRYGIVAEEEFAAATDRLQSYLSRRAEESERRILPFPKEGT